jgi:hypothetical protein
MRLTFLQHIYDHCGDRRDLEAAGRALAPVWLIAGRDGQPALQTPTDVPPVSLRSVLDCDNASNP